MGHDDNDNIDIISEEAKNTFQTVKHTFAVVL